MGRVAWLVQLGIVALALGCDDNTEPIPAVEMVGAAGSAGSAGSAGTGLENFAWIEPTERVATTAGVEYFQTEGLPVGDGSVILGTAKGFDAIWQSRIVEGFVWTKQSGTIGLGGLPNVHPDLVSYLSQPLAATADGSVVVGRAVTPDFDGVAFRWTASDGLEVLVDQMAQPVALSSDGAVVLGRRQFSTPPLSRVFRWTREAGASSIELEPGESTWPLDLSDDGGTVLAESEQGLFLWTERTGAELLELAPSLRRCSQSDPWRLSSQISYGHVAGGRCINAAGRLEPFVWTAQQGMVGLGTLAGYEPQLVAVDEGGSVAVGMVRPDEQATVPAMRPFRWTQATGMVLLELPPGHEFAELIGGRTTMSRDGSVIVGLLRDSAVDGSSAAAAGSFRWSDGTGSIALLPLEGHTRAEVHGLSSDGAMAVGASYVLQAELRQFETAVVWYADGVAHRVADELNLQIHDGLLQTTEHVPSTRALAGSGLANSGRLLWHASLLDSLP